ncbi:alpha/beta fold hydrolase [Salinimicrobium xinjiangense]|uniref:alpha/beta fold hydrolase n=1 Tax=Salinimicrobium xinjiangense TaxID=438596 RepID=UPI00041E7496|nr:alpha/beta hydrolase [Salinimicrobium xinjiangense]
MRHLISLLIIGIFFVEPLFGQSDFIDINSHQMNVETAGLDAREPGEPVIIFESPSGGTVKDWDSIFYKAASIAPVIRYDRSGLGKSEWNGKKPSPENIAVHLLELLETMEIKPPYVLVGHSWGTQLVRHFAYLYPEKTGGLILLDPGFRPNTFKAALEDIGASPEEGFKAYLDTFKDNFDNPNYTENQVRHFTAMAEWFVSPFFPPTPQTPVAALLGGKPGPGPPLLAQLPFDYDKWIIAINRREMERLLSWTLDSPDGIFILADQSGHYIQHDEPALVLAAIRNVVDKSPSNSE